MAEEAKRCVYKKEFVAELAWRTGLTLEEAAEVTQAFLSILKDRFSVFQAVSFENFGTFTVHMTPERMGRNPLTMEEHVIPAGYKPVFRASKVLRELVTQSISEGNSPIPEQTLIKERTPDDTPKRGRPKKATQAPTGYSFSEAEEEPVEVEKEA